MRKHTAHISLSILGFLLAIVSSSCTSKTGAATATEPLIDSLIPQYSHTFRVDYYKNFKVVKIFSGKDNKTTTSYLLCKKDQPLHHGFESAVRINFPVTKIACMSTTHIGALSLLNARDLIASVTNPNLICDSQVSSLIKAGQIKTAGKDYQPDYEIIAQLKPDMLFSDGENNGSSQMYAKMKALGINVVSSRDYFEQEPLARAEWIKFFAAFIGKEKQADSIFTLVKAKYQEQKNLVAETGERPTVFCNIPYSGVWYMPCGDNYIAKLITDAGGKFLWNEEKPINGLNLTLNFEQVYQRAADADFWINTGTFSDRKQIENADTKFKLFKAFKTYHIYNCTKRLSPAGGMDIWETGAFRPDLVLSDLSLILHYKDDLPQGRLYYYQKLK